MPKKKQPDKLDLPPNLIGNLAYHMAKQGIGKPEMAAAMRIGEKCFRERLANPQDFRQSELALAAKKLGIPLMLLQYGELKVAEMVAV